MIQYYFPNTCCHGHIIFKNTMFYGYFLIHMYALLLNAFHTEQYPGVKVSRSKYTAYNEVDAIECRFPTSGSTKID